MNIVLFVCDFCRTLLFYGEFFGLKQGVEQQRAYGEIRAQQSGQQNGGKIFAGERQRHARNDVGTINDQKALRHYDRAIDQRVFQAEIDPFSLIRYSNVFNKSGDGECYRQQTG